MSQHTELVALRVAHDDEVLRVLEVNGSGGSSRQRFSHRRLGIVGSEIQMPSILHDLCVGVPDEVERYARGAE